MSARRVGWLAAMLVAVLFWMSCGEVYRPVVIPNPTNPPNPQNFHSVFAVSNNVAPNPGTALQVDVSGDSNIGAATMGINPTHAVVSPNFSRVFVTSAGSVVFGNADLVTAFVPATAAGIGSTITYSLPNVGPNQSSAITAIRENDGANPNLVTVTLASAITKAVVGGPIVISGVIIPGKVPNPAGYDGNFTISSVNGTTITYNDPISGLATLAATTGTATVPLPTFCSYLPDFITTTQTNAAYVANYGQENGLNCNLASTDSIVALNTANNTISRIAYLPAGSHPTLLSETPNAQNLYVVNQGDGNSPATILNLSTVDLSTTASITVGANPAWIAMRLDGQRVYVVTQGNGQLYTIATDTNAIVSTQSVGSGANYVLYDKNLNRLYVTSPAPDTNSNGLVYVFSAVGSTPTPLPTPVGNPPGALIIPPVPPCATAPTTCGPVIPSSVAALPDGSRFYVASYQIQNPCSDAYAGTGSCIIPMVTVFDARNLTIRAASSSYFGAELSLLSSPPFGPVVLASSVPPQYAVPELPACDVPDVYSPGSTRFRMFATAAADSSHVYVSVCDAGAVADIATNTNTINQGTNAADKLVTDITAPLSPCSALVCSSAAITSFSIGGNVVTVQANNSFMAGQLVQISGLTQGTYLNGQILTVLPAGLSGTQFEAAFTHADVGSTQDAGTAAPVTPPPAAITAFSIQSNVITFQAANAFTPGTRVAISNLSSAAATTAGLNGKVLTVIAAGLSGTQFECVLPTAQTDVNQTADTGSAVPQVFPQTPIFLLTGQ